MSLIFWIAAITIKNCNMGQVIRTKFNVAEIAQFGNGGGSKVVLLPVIGYSPENEEFWKATPVGRVELHLSNQEAAFKFGEYYLDFTPVDHGVDTPVTDNSAEITAVRDQLVGELMNAIAHCGAGLSADELDKVSNAIKAWADYSEEYTAQEDVRIGMALTEVGNVVGAGVGSFSATDGVYNNTMSMWGTPELVSAQEVGLSIELVYVQRSTMSFTNFGAVGQSRRVYKIIYSCKNGMLHKSAPIEGQIIPSTEEQYSFKQ
jgi:hypothetical protein